LSPAATVPISRLFQNSYMYRNQYYPSYIARVKIL